MSDNKRIKTALISVFYKDGLEEILSLLHADGVKFLSTGGTRSFIEGLGYECDAVEDLTGYPSILGGRVKTLHPKVFGGILNRRENEGDRAQIAQYEIPEIDLVIVDLYPFSATVASGAPEADIIEKIDIGGISLIRAAAKNYNDVIIVASKAQYKPLAEMLKRNGGAVSSLEERRWFASQAFAVSSGYDSDIYNYFNRTAVESPIEQKESLQPSIAILKHNNACGLATRPTIAEAWKDALAGDPVSAFGGVLITNGTVDESAAEEINKIFFEVIIAPEYTEAALEILKQKKNRIILVIKKALETKCQFRSILNGALVQDRDLKIETVSDLKQVTEKAVSPAQAEDLLFANKIVKNSKSNSIVLAKDKMLIASGVGQTSRVDALKQAIEKAHSFGFDLHGAVMASDAFFPFPDCVEIAGNAGVTAVVHPGGSIRDQESVDYCNTHGIAMVTTGFRHFKH